ncbi:MAG: DNA-3-methyladenine glycosylase 2 family protein [Acidimicrobiaceae bacterium]|nr:DNA-3-methyladenine glycosylase 2 family protein [Acidimicrobiaceae bacterium]
MGPRTNVAADIVARDRSFADVVQSVGPAPARRLIPVAGRFSSLISSISYQLLATSTARTIHARVIEVCGGAVSTESVLRAGPENLRHAGLSRTKASAMIDLATHVRDGRIDFAAHGRMSDEAIVAEVTSVHGVGPWTAQMYLMQTLARRDVWPVGDFGVRQGWSLLHHLDEIITEKELLLRGDIFVGVRSDVAWYCWQAVHLHRSNQ